MSKNAIIHLSDLHKCQHYLQFNYFGEETKK